ncbi:MAG: TRAP transporter permease DctQ, partial [Hylemonella sp.]|nr:TRAP transporter permease DctQ [Hylemonella sp.]
GILALVFSGLAYGLESMRIAEVSVNSPVGVPIWPLKMIIPVAGLTLLLQGVAEVCRCLITIRENAWPARGDEIVELEVALQQQFKKEGQAL